MKALAKRAPGGVTAFLCAASFFMPWWQNGLELCLLCAMLLLLADTCFAAARRRPWRLTGPGAALFAFAVWAGISTAFSPDVAGSRYNYFYHVVCCVVMYLLVGRYVRDSRQARHLLSYLLAGAGVACLYSVYLYLTAHGSAAEWVDAARFPLLRRRMYGTLGNPNLLGAYLLIVSSMLASFTAVYERGRKRSFFALVLLVFLLVLALSYSRGAWLAAFMVLALTAIVYDRRATWAALAVPSVLFFYHGQVAERFWSLFRGTDTSVSLRYAFWRSTAAMILDHPLHGIGWAAYPYVYPQYDYFLHNADVLIYHAHNLYLHLAAETGLIGLALYLIAFWGHGILAWRLYRQSCTPLVRAYALGIVLAVFGMSINGMFDHNFFSRTVSLTFWTLAALLPTFFRMNAAAEWKKKQDGD